MSDQRQRGTSRFASLERRLWAPVDAASLVFFRLGFGLLMVWDLLHYVLDGRLERLYAQPLVHFTFYGFDWVKVAPDGILRLIFWLLVGLAAAIAAGLWYRLAAALFAVGYGYVLLLDAAAYNNHNYLILLLAILLIFVPAHRAGSLDALRRRDLRSPVVPAWALWLLRFQVGVPYFFGGVAKLNYDWLVAAQPMRMWLETDNLGGSLRLAFFDRPWFAAFMSWGGALFDLAVVPLLLWRRTRLAAFLLASAFHVANSHLFNIGVFPWLMICATTLYFAPDWPRRSGLIGRPPGRRARPAKAIAGRRRRLSLALLGAWVAIQVLMPLRHWLYPGNVDWTDEAHRFSWRMKVRDKQGEVRFMLVDHRTRKATLLNGAEAVLTPRQRRMMTQDPEMIRQFAHYLAARLAERGVEGGEIHALTRISLNGRPPQALIDPEVDLAAEPPSLLPRRWIVPLEPRR
ncbi:MAG: vitamin K-dependent gamma-carboxylase [Acidobacteria bacterium]|nr:MAG: vitamin K-dependent gamma-carboxylase [Acidobacteriota bacterium]